MLRDNRKKICLCNQYLLTIKKLVINYKRRDASVEDKTLWLEMHYKGTNVVHGRNLKEKLEQTMSFDVRQGFIFSCLFSFLREHKSLIFGFYNCSFGLKVAWNSL